MAAKVPKLPVRLLTHYQQRQPSAVCSLLLCIKKAQEHLFHIETIYPATEVGFLPKTRPLKEPASPLLCYDRSKT